MCQCACVCYYRYVFICREVFCAGMGMNEFVGRYLYVGAASVHVCLCVYMCGCVWEGCVWGVFLDVGGVNV